MGSKYSVGLVGESWYPTAVRAAREGDEVVLAFEPDNPKDRMAIVAMDRHGNRLGYVGRDNFVQRIMHTDKRTVAAHVMRVHEAPTGDRRGIVLEVELDAGFNPTVAYAPPPPAKPASMPQEEPTVEPSQGIAPKLVLAALIACLLLVVWLIS